MASIIPTIAVVLCTFNRKSTSLGCLECLFDQAGMDVDFKLRTIVVDDKSTDGTADAIRHEFPSVEISTSDGDWYWAKSMSVGMDCAMRDGDCDFILMLNDDVILKKNALQNLLNTWAATQSPLTVTVGGTKATADEVTTYSGISRLSRRPGNLKQVAVDDVFPQFVDTFHGNIVLIPEQTLRLVGVIDPEFAHAYGDIDYGLRCSNLGVPILLAAGFQGICDRNAPQGTFTDIHLPRRERLRLALGVKGFPIKSHAAYNQRHGGSLWVGYFAATYMRLIVRILRKR